MMGYIISTVWKYQKYQEETAMRRLKVLLLQFIIIALILSLCPIQVSAETANEPSSWAAQQISILKMLSFGNPDIYSIQQDITRDEFCW